MTRPVPSECPSADYASAWTQLRGYLVEAVQDDAPFAATEVLRYVDELHREVMRPIREWMDAVLPPKPGGAA